MAEIASVKQNANSARSLLTLWEAMGDDDTGAPVLVGERPDGSVQVTGTFGGATFTLEGSNDGTNFVVLRDDSGTTISLTSAGLQMFMQRTLWIRPQTSGGTGTDVDVYLLLGG